MNLDEIRRRIECEQQNMPKYNCCCGTRNQTPTLTIGTVTTGEAGTEASASITGTAPDYELNLTIPQGEQGTAGEDGETPTLTIGTVTTGEAGTEASASITGTAPNYVLNLTIPRGDPGTTT